MIREGLYYSKDHEWLRIDGASAVIGITDFAQEALGDLTFVELPKVGKTVKARESLAVVSRSRPPATSTPRWAARWRP